MTEKEIRGRIWRIIYVELGKANDAQLRLGRRMRPFEAEALRREAGQRGDDHLLSWMCPTADKKPIFEMLRNSNPEYRVLAEQWDGLSAQMALLHEERRALVDQLPKTPLGCGVSSAQRYANARAAGWRPYR